MVTSRIVFSSLSLLVALILCFSPIHCSNTIGKGYRLISIEESPDGGFIGYLQVKQKNKIYGSDITTLRLYVKHETDTRLRVHITDAKKQRWEVPYNLLPREQPPPVGKVIGKSRKSPITVQELSGSELIFSYTTDPFSFAVKRRSNGQTLFNTSSNSAFGEMVFKDQYLEISTSLPKDASIYGLGENSQANGIKLVPNEPYTLYTEDVSAINLNTDLYGSHPVYMDLRNVGGKPYAHAVLLLNSNGMDVFYRGTSLTYKVIGGVFDFYFVAGPSPLDVVDQYTSLIGRPAPMPYWSLGFHQCRWGYRNLSVIEDVVDSYQKAKIPLDVIWNDDDHMDAKKDFTLSPISYPRAKLLNFLDRIHKMGMKYVVINDPGIGVNSSYGVYQRGMANDVFIKYEGKPFLAQVWPGAVHFPDFLNPKTVSWWGEEIRRFHELVPIDGLWIDMNEVSNFCSGLCTIPKGKKCPTGEGPGWICCLDCKNITKTRWDDPPYKINATGVQAPIGFKTIATSALHYNGVREYDAHSIYGFSETVATHKGLLSIEGKRPFILSRSTFVGSGKYAAHWTGDNQGTWQSLQVSISTMLNFGIFGVPMVGSDICGFYPQPTEELCNRWIEVGAFYPFSRDHANYYSPRQELYQWDTVAESARNALGMRYKILPYLYTLNYEAHMTGAPIARPLFFSFPEYTECYGSSRQFLLGSGLMISPVLEQGKTEVEALFPPGSWYHMFDMTQAVVSKKGKRVTLPAPLNFVNVHLYQNTILPMQQGGLISKEARTTPFSLVITFPAGASEGYAKGKLYLDEDELPEMKLGNGQSTYVDFYASVGNGTVKMWSEVKEGKFALSKGWVIEKVSVLGLRGGGGQASEIVINGSPVSNEGKKVEVNLKEHTYVVGLEEEGENKSVMVEVRGLEMLVGAKTRWSCFVNALFAIAVLAIAHFSNCESVLSEKEQNKVSKLPGQNFNVNFAHYSGFVTTNEKLGRALFYWLIEAAEDPASKPLVLWLNGGPGCSSVGFGEAEEIGPFHIKPDGKTLYLNQYSWNQAANILFLDAPVGVGFSYSNTSSDLLTNGDKRTAQDSLTFLLKWVERYPEYKGREFYIVGESYAGHYIPQLSQAIVRHNQASGENTVNLKGYMVGNGLMDDRQDQLGLFQYIWTLGFISDQTYTLLKLQCGLEPFIHSSEACNNALEISYKEMGNIDHYSVFTPACVASASQSRMLLKRRPVNSRVSEQYDPCTEKHSKVYFNLPEVQRALHVPPEVAPSKWDTCNYVVNENWNDCASSVLDIYHELIAAGIRIWVFSGDADAVVPVTSTRYSIDALNLSTTSPYGPWYIDGQVGGWTQQYAGLNFVTVRGAGHEVPLHRPKEALALFKAFISGTPLLSTPEKSIRSEMSELVSDS